MKNKLFALALAGVTVIGAFATGTPIMATGLSSGGGESSGSSSSSTTGNTTVTLTVPEQQPEGTYEITIPANTTLDKDGSAVALKNGIKVSGSNMTSGVTVTAKSDFKLKADGVDTTVGYGLYANDTDTNTTTSWEFTADEINANDGNGTTKAVYGRVNTDDVKDAKAGNYSDTITFVAAKDPTAADVFEDGAEYRVNILDTIYNFKYVMVYKYNDSKFTCIKLIQNQGYGDENKLDELGEKCSTSKDETVLKFKFGQFYFNLDTSTNSYTLTEEIGSSYEITKFEVKPAGASDFTDIFSTLKKVDSLD